MLIFKFISVGVLGAGLACLVRLYLLDKHNDKESIEILSLAIMALTIKNEVFRILGLCAFIFVDFETVTSWLCFGFGYSGMLYAIMGAGEKKLENCTEKADVSNHEEMTPLEFTHTIVLVCFFVTTCLLILSTSRFLIQ